VTPEFGTKPDAKYDCLVSRQHPCMLAVPSIVSEIVAHTKDVHFYCIEGPCDTADGIKVALLLKDDQIEQFLAASLHLEPKDLYVSTLTGLQICVLKDWSATTKRKVDPIISLDAEEDSDTEEE